MNRRWRALLAVLAGIVVVGLAEAAIRSREGFIGGRMHLWGDGAAGTGWAVLGGILGVVSIALVITAVVLFVRLVACRPACCATGPDSAIDILKDRYARGEISREEFEEKKKSLA